MNRRISNRLFFLCVFAFALGQASTMTHASEDLAVLATSCKVCHVGYLALTAKPPDQLVEAITALRNRTAVHPPISIDHLGDQEIHELARMLNNSD